MLAKKDVNMVKVRRFAEFTVEQLWDQIKNDEKIRQYLPEPEWLTRKMDRDFTFNVAFTVRREFMEEIFKDAIDSRMSMGQGDDEDLDVCQEMKDLLLEHPYLPSK